MGYIDINDIDDRNIKDIFTISELILNLFYRMKD